MTSYNGPATLVDGDTEIKVDAHLIAEREPGQLGAWGGIVKCDPDALFPVLGKNVTIRLPEGHAGTVLVLEGGELTGGGGPPPSGD